MMEWLRQRACTHPNGPALTDMGRTWTFSELSADVDCAAAYLEAQNVRRGDRVAIVARNSSDYCILIFALMRVGAVAVPINTRLAGPEVTRQLQDVRPRLLLHDEVLEGIGASAVPPGVATADVRAWKRAPARLPALSTYVHSDEAHAILFTSGTTGRAKGAVLTYGNHWASAIGSVLNLGLRPDDAWLLCLPLFHIGGLAIVLRSVIYGTSVILHERFRAEDVLRTIDNRHVTHISLVSAMLEQLLELRGERPLPERVRCLLVGGGPVPKPLLERGRNLSWPVVQTYGMTETASQVATLSPEDALNRLGSAGKPLLGTEIRIQVDADSRDGIGEIWVRGAVVSPGYWGEPQLSGRKPDEWFCTGDLGWIDEDGYLHVASRRSDLIISGGENVYPAEVEAVLARHPEILESAVVARPDPRWGEVPVAYFVPRGEAPPRESLETHCRNHLARYKVPVAFYPIAALPRNANGKVLRGALRDDEYNRQGC